MSKKRSRESLNLDITPLIDVVFLLLIFFMVSTIFKNDDLALLLNLPSSTKGQQIAEEQLNTTKIEVNDKEIAFNGKTISESELPKYLKQISDKTQSIQLRIDKDVKYKRVIYFLDTLKSQNLTNIELITGK